MTDSRTRPRWWAPVGVAVLLAVLAIGCGGNQSGNDAAPGDTSEALGSADTSPDIVKPTSGEPKRGGKLVFAVEAETDGWNPTTNRWANSGTQVALSIFDPLVALDKDLQPKPYLAESLTPNAAFTEWVVKLRPNVKFHNGQPLNAAALVKSVTALKASPLTGAAAKPIVKAEPVDDLSVKLTMDQPWAVFPSVLTAQAGVVPAPAMLDDAANGSRNPVGTGPFKFQDWTPDKSLSVTRNESYWRQGLPYLDSVEFRPLPDSNSRYGSLQSGDVQVLISSQESTIQRMLDDAKDGKFQVVRSIGNNDVTMVLFNTSAPPFDDLRARQGLAYAIDRKALSEVSGSDPSLSADSVFQPDSVWYAPQPDYPKFDPAKAKQLIEAYEAEKGPLKFTFGSTTDPQVLAPVQALAAQWNAAGAEVDIKTFDQTVFITNAVTGQYQAHIWRQFGSADPDPNYIWWHSANAEGTLALNMARNKDPKIDAALQKGRGTTDVATRKQAYEEVAKQFTATVPYIWLNHLRWTAAADNRLRGIQGMPLPDGTQSAGLVGGVLPVTAMWFET